MTRVVNVYRDPHDVYIGRRGRGEDGYFGNPIRPGRRCPECGTVHVGRDPAILACYRSWFRARLRRDHGFANRVEELDDRSLGCFCAPRPCHGDVIAAYLDAVKGGPRLTGEPAPVPVERVATARDAGILPLLRLAHWEGNPWPDRIWSLVGGDVALFWPGGRVVIRRDGDAWVRVARPDVAGEIAGHLL